MPPTQLLSPLYATDLSGLPPALIITAQYDTLRDEAAAYARRLRAADVPAVYSCYPGMIHGFLQMGGIVADARTALEEIARTLSDDVWIVAPDEERSGAGHSLTLSYPLRYREIEKRRYEVSGTPTDCVVMAVRKIMPGLPDLILSGVNRGQNIAEDVTYSGTIAAAMEGTSLGIKSIVWFTCENTVAS